MERRLTARNLHDIGLTLVSHYGFEHLFDLVQAAESPPLGPAFGITNRAFQIAIVADFDERQTRMLLVIGAQYAIIRAPPFDRSVVSVRHLRRFDEHFARTAVIFNIVSDEHAFGAVRGAAFE